MKKSGLFSASMAAASAAYSVSSSYTYSMSSSSSKEGLKLNSKKDDGNSEIQKSQFEDKFAPRFDGLRFIETLVTAHR